MTIIGNRFASLSRMGLYGREETIIKFWRAGHDTLAIARLLGTSESEIYNALPSVRERARQTDDWNSQLTKHDHP